jgi:hypothetical protein
MKNESTLIEKLQKLPPRVWKSQKLLEWVNAYWDIEQTIEELKKANANNKHFSAIQYINIKKLVEHLTQSKKRLERKINNKLLLEKQHLKRRIKKWSDQIKIH